MIYVALNINIVILYEIQFNLNHSSATLHILLHVIICVIYIQRMNDQRYNTKFNIWFHEKMFYHVKLYHVFEHVQTQFILTIIIFMSIIKLYVCLNIETEYHNYLYRRYRFIQNIGSTVYHQELEDCSYIISRYALSQPLHYLVSIKTHSPKKMLLGILLYHLLL